MRPFFNRIVGAALIVLFAATWLLPGGIDSLLPFNLGGAATVARPLHEGTQWARYLAPEGTCRGEDEVGGEREEQLFAMRCLLDWARRERGLAALPLDPQLNHSSALKAEAIQRCNEFSHTVKSSEVV